MLRQVDNPRMEATAVDTDHKRVELAKRLRSVTYRNHRLLRRLSENLPKMMATLLVEGFKGQR